MIANKSKPTTIDEYIAGFTSPIKAKLEEIRRTIRRAAPEANETINYQIPTFVLHGNLVHFAAFKNHIRFYPTPSGIEAFKKELSEYEGVSFRPTATFGIDYQNCKIQD
ncbi:MAG: DUF1801 domain-containing protein [Saprospiraceae bacterium]|nr:DUF1801 domain-containing protein [Saprospiraceae bacterium]